MSARFLLDTDICIYRLNNRSPGVRARFDRLRPAEAVISVVAFGELAFGAAKSRDPATANAHIESLLVIAAVAPLPTDAARHYAQIRRDLESRGMLIGSNDLWIAAHAKAANLVLVTNNEREFRRIGGLKIQNWAA